MNADTIPANGAARALVQSLSCISDGPTCLSMSMARVTCVIRFYWFLQPRAISCAMPSEDATLVRRRHPAGTAGLES